MFVRFIANVRFVSLCNILDPQLARHLTFEEFLFKNYNVNSVRQIPVAFALPILSAFAGKEIQGYFYTIYTFTKS